MNDPTPVRIATYNLQKCVGLDLRRRPARCLEVIAALRADLVVLQEADKRLPPRPAALPHAQILQAGWQVLPFAAPGRPSLGWHGNAMLARGGIEIKEVATLNLPGLEPRGAIRAELITGLGALRVLGVHLGLIRRYRQMQLAAILRALQALPPCPTVVTGDFNDWTGRAVLAAAAPGLRIADTPPSYPALRPLARLDRFLHSPDLRLSGCNIGTHRKARIASDHLPIWADFTLERARVLSHSRHTL